ncbi:MAG: GntR family transcriptional regulator [Pseudomonadota bacterium]
MTIKPDSSKTVSSQLFEAIRADIIAGVLPPDSKLNVKELTERYSASAMPLREALSRLANSGLVEAIDQRGFRVTSVSAEELLDVTRTRQLIETAALRKAITTKDVQWEAAVLAAHHNLKSLPILMEDDIASLNPEWEAAHDAFHKTLIGGAGSRWLSNFATTLRDQSARYRRASVATRAARARDVAAEHAQIVEAILERDADAACALLAAHFGATTDLLLADFGAAAVATR